MIAMQFNNNSSVDFSYYIYMVSNKKQNDDNHISETFISEIY